MAVLRKRVNIYRGEIWVVDLHAGVGWEVAKKRPALVISNNQINRISPLVVIIPISSRIPEILGPERILISKKQTGLVKDSVMMINQIRTIDKKRLVSKTGKISEERLLEVEESLKLVLGMVDLDN